MASAASGHGTNRSAILVDAEPQPGTSQMSDQNGISMESENGHDDKNVFQVNTHLIPRAHLRENSELDGLGLGVFNQQEFEEGVMAQVDQAMAKEEEERLTRILNKELKAVEDDFEMANKELDHINKVFETMPEFTKGISRDVRQTIESIKKQRDNKMKHLKKLESRKSVLQGKLENVKVDAAVLNMAFGQQGKDVKIKKKVKESERDRMIRLGHMTPFGTIIKSKGKSKSSSKKSKQNGVANKKKHKLPSQASTAGSPVKKRKSGNFFDERDHRNYDPDRDFTHPRYQRRGSVYPRLEHNFQDEEPSWEEENMYMESGDEYVPEEGELLEIQSDEEEGIGDDATEGTLNKRNKKPSLRKRHIPPAYEDPFSKLHAKTKTKRCPGIRKARDDGDENYYERRMRDCHKQELRKQYEQENGLSREGDEEEDEEFDGGLKVPGSIWHKLYQYQKVGVRWLWELHQQQAGGIVGDEMGLGKTIQAIAFLAALKYSKLPNTNFSYNGLGPTLIVCPATVMHQWVKEFHKWWPYFRVAILHASGSYTGKEKDLIYSVARSHGVLVTSFSTMVIQQEALLQYNWHYIMLDEGHKIRNPDAQITLACKQIRTSHRIILSGSPIQNNLKELWSLFDFVFPGKLGMLPDFMQHFSVPIVQGGYANATQVQVETAYKCASVLRDTINPFLLRRMKADVKANLNLPEKNEQVLFCRLTDDQREVYKEYLDSRECQSILAGKFMIFPGLITLRKVCNHPDLSTGGPRVLVGEDTHGDPALEYGYYQRSGKMIVVDTLLGLWQKQGQRVLLFSQSRTMLDIMESFVQERQYSYIRMDGTTPISARQKLIDQYNQDNGIFVFLLTTRVGGLGVNLTGANRVIIFDPDWNPSTDTQARERAWRIGQKREVTIYRLLTSGTIEEKIYHRQIFKQFLTNRVLKDPKQRRFFKSNDIYDLFTLTDGGEDTETSAIFAGTGSNVKIPKAVKSEKKVNRFDELKKKAELKKEDSFVKSFDTDEIERMREMARMLSRKMEEEKKKKKQNSAQEGHEPSLNKRKLSPQGNVKVKKEKDKKHKKKKKRKDAKFEGERVPYLDRQSQFNAKDGEGNEKMSKKQDDDYVLRQLFKKNGIQGAMQHDKIMGSGRPDFALVEAEAEKVAKQAVAALKKSRSQCYTATSGIPTWTGQHGGQSKPKFGAKKNSLLSNKIKPQAAPSATITSKEAEPEGDKMFDGNMSGTVALSSKAGIMSSNDLLSKMRTRHNLSQQGNEDIGGNPDQVEANDLELMTDMRNYIAFQCHMDGQASTKELLDEFGPRLPKGSAAKFKAMLNQICDLDKSSGVGIWKLRLDFR